MRLDQLMILKGLARSRSQAKDFIDLGLVNVDGKLAKKLSKPVTEDAEIVVKDHPIARYVSRAGLKISAACERIGVEVADRVVLDIGQSTGGYSDYCLQAGAKKVVGVDVGEGQIDESLKSRENLVFFEKVNARNLSQFPDVLGELTDISLVVMDVSFISITLIIPEIAKCFAEEKPYLLSLVKPQFELSKKYLNKKGIVSNSAFHLEVQNKIKDCMAENKFTDVQFFQSSILGADGNKEFFIYGKLS